MPQKSNQHKLPDSILSNWSKKLQNRWGVSQSRVIIILFVFACTGTTVMLLKYPVISFFTDGLETPILFTILYYVLILPIYNVFLLLFGFIFGQFKFFWNFEKKMLSRIFKYKK